MQSLRQVLKAQAAADSFCGVRQHLRKCQCRRKTPPCKNCPTCRTHPDLMALSDPGLQSTYCSEHLHCAICACLCAPDPPASEPTCFACCSQGEHCTEGGRELVGEVRWLRHYALLQLHGTYLRVMPCPVWPRSLCVLMLTLAPPARLPLQPMQPILESSAARPVHHPSSRVHTLSPDPISAAPAPRCPGVGKWTEGDEASRHAFWLRTQRRRGALTRLGLQGEPQGEHELQPLTLPDQQLLKRLPADLRAQVQALQVGGT